MNLLFESNTNQDKTTKVCTPFKLPITYIENDVHCLPPNVSADLELDKLINEPQEVADEIKKQQPMYYYLFKPQNKFAENTIPLWKTHFTSNVHYLKETQSIISNLNIYKKNMDLHTTCTNYSPQYENIIDVWHTTKEDPEFLDKYSYMDIEWLKWLNRMPSFLQTMSFVNMTSPVLALIIPFIFILAPFIILKIQGMPVTFTMYLDVLCNLAKYHFIGKAVNMLRDFSVTNLIYFCLMTGFYLYQCYSNYNSCIRFYKNIRKMNQRIIETRNYLDYSIESIGQFMNISKTCLQYKPFHIETSAHIDNLISLRQVLANVAPFEPSLSKVTEIGLLMRCFYEIHENHVYGQSLFWSFGFEGYMNNLLGIHANLAENRIAYAEYSETCNKTVYENQYYPAHMYDTYVSNDCKLDKNMVITGPNAAGKTTFLKTTLLNVLFSQQIGCGFYKSCKINPYTHIHSYLNIPDTSARDSLFQAESRRCKEILDAVLMNPVDNARHFCVFDELYSGTNPEEATKSAYAFLLYLAKYENVDFILTTHYVSVCKRLRKVPTVRNWQMEARELADGEIKYSYKIGRGISKIQGAFSVLRQMGYPEEILNTIRGYRKK